MFLDVSRKNGLQWNGGQTTRHDLAQCGLRIIILNLLYSGPLSQEPLFIMSSQ